jgi:phosphatidylglycerol lysyltransferase
MLTFSGVTYYLGASAVIVAGGLVIPQSAFSEIGMIRMLFGLCSAFLGAYFAACLFFNGKGFKIGSAVFSIPSPRTALIQATVGMTDSILAGLVLYFLSMHFAGISAVRFVSVFVIAQSAGIFSQVPGGIGVFESVVLVAMPPEVDRAALFASLLAFRVIYFLLPLFGIGTTFFIYEHYLRRKMRKWRMFSIHLHIPGIKKERKQ